MMISVFGQVGKLLRYTASPQPLGNNMEMADIPLF
jgi:hypothetical protein